MALSDAVRHKRRRPRRAGPSRDTIKDRASIHDRPKTIESRGEAGHWEGDLIICKGTRPVLVLHERKSRATLAARFQGKPPQRPSQPCSRCSPHRSSSAKINHFRQRHRLRPARPAQDHARHDDLFCDAYASWQKGGIENANGRLRRWLPSTWISTRHPTRTSRRSSSHAQPHAPQCLRFKTLFQALLAELGKDVQIHFS